MKKLPDFDLFMDFMMNEYERDDDSDYWDFNAHLKPEGAIINDGKTIDFTALALYMQQQNHVYLIKVLRAYHAWLSQYLSEIG